MPVYLNHHDCPGNELLLTHIEGTRRNSPQRPNEDAPSIHIGLVNNMPDAALQATERQFLTLIDSASKNIMVRVSFYALPDVPRTEAGRIQVSRFYLGMEALWDSHLDGLIITGAEPRASRLIDEPYWRSLTRVLEWAECNTRSAVVSCLSAHAAVFHFDGIDRHRFSEKRSGLFECRRVSCHQLTADTPSRFRMPHSRWNGISESDLSRNNYLVLTRSADAGVDMFVKQKKSLFVCFQGHPEYESNTLLLEYHRDVGRFLRRKVDTPPSLPEGYFDAPTLQLLATLRGEALIDALLVNSETPCRENRIASSWHSVAKTIYANWLNYLCGGIDDGIGLGASAEAENWMPS
jgi:homoserine O-succinyltransferase